jgi:hypothetical protein
MPHVEESITIHAPQERVAGLYRDYRGWPRLFPATIRGVRLVRDEPPCTTLEIDHREGLVPNVMTEVAPERIDLWESKRHYDATFINRFESVTEGTRYAVSADVTLKGAAKILGPLLHGYIRRQICRYVLEPMRQAAEGAY